MARDLPGLVRAGAAIVGGCCGSTPAHIRRFRQVLDGGAA
jgi:5-methyltetrahydrofolate--homocysteine methyltransferase